MNENLIQWNHHHHFENLRFTSLKLQHFFSFFDHHPWTFGVCRLWSCLPLTCTLLASMWVSLMGDLHWCCIADLASVPPSYHHLLLPLFNWFMTATSSLVPNRVLPYSESHELLNLIPWLSIFWFLSSFLLSLKCESLIFSCLCFAEASSVVAVWNT